MGGSSTPLLSVKYAVPPTRTGTVARQRLADRLEDSVDTRLCVVVAPPGWGKTTMLAQWTAEPVVRGRAAWVSLDPSDDEPIRFWSYLLTALAVSRRTWATGPWPRCRRRVSSQSSSLCRCSSTTRQPVVAGTS